MKSKTLEIEKVDFIGTPLDILTTVKKDVKITDVTKNDISYPGLTEMKPVKSFY